jgi:Flp pilus assembly protein TadD
MGKYLEALPVMENAIALMPQEPVINDHLGDVYWKIGRKTEALFQWNHALDFKPSPKDKAMLEAKIAVGYDKAKDYLKKQKTISSKKQKIIADTHTDTDLPQESSFLNMIKSFFGRFSTNPAKAQ